MTRLVAATLAAVCLSVLSLTPGPAFAAEREDWNSEYKQASELLDAEDAAGALPHAEKSLAFSERKFGRESVQTGISLSILGECYARLKRYGELETTSRRAVEVCRKAKAGDLVQINLGRLARACHWQKKYVEAEQAYAEEIALLEPASLREPTKPRIDLLVSLDALADVRVELGKKYEAVEPMRQMLAALDRGMELEPGRVAGVVGEMAGSILKIDRPTWIDTLSADFVQVVERRFPGDVKAVCYSRATRATVYLWLGKNAEAERLMLRIAADLEKTYGPEDGDIPGTYDLITALYKRSGRAEEAAAIEARRARGSAGGSGSGR